MKKILAMLLVIMLFGGCTSKSYMPITYDEFNTKMDNDDSFVLVISRATCPHCDTYKKTINKVINNYGVDIYMVDMDDFSEDEINLFKTLIKWDYSTPITVFVTKGEELSTYDRIIGDQEYGDVVNRLKDMGYIE